MTVKNITVTNILFDQSGLLALEEMTGTIDVLDNWRVTAKKKRMMGKKYVIIKE